MSRLCCSHARQMLARNTGLNSFHRRLGLGRGLTHTHTKFRGFHSLSSAVDIEHKRWHFVCQSPNINLTQSCSEYSNGRNFTFSNSRTYSRRNRSNVNSITHDTGHENDEKVSALFIPVEVPIKTSKDPDDFDIGEELGGNLKKQKDKLIKILEEFSKRPTIRMLAEEKGLDDNLFHQAFRSFQNYIINSQLLEPELHIVLGDLLASSGQVHVDDIFPYFIRHAHRVFPALDCMDDLKKISDLTDPAQWYPEARAIKRKIIFHAGPTNSGKTYHALERFCAAKSGVYCGPLKLLASEVHGKTNERGILCDMVTGEERRYARTDGLPSDHIACTVEMTNVAQPYEVAVIDEIQMLRDPARGWAWTRAFLGLCAEEIHLCGEPAAVDMVKQLALSTGDEVEVRDYRRLTPLQILDKPLGNLENVRAGDCIVGFSKKDLYQISRDLEAMGKECAVIYGSLPPGTKLGQAKMFNDPDHSCKILVATDAIGMGLNLSIKRIIFYSITKPSINEKGELHVEPLSTSQALQIAGRAGRYATEFAQGEATTFHAADLPVLKEILAGKVEPIMMAGLHPTAEQIELFAYHLPDASLSNLIDIFIKLSHLENNYFVCNMEDFKALAEMLEHIPLHLRARYVFCCAPLDRRQAFVCTMFLKFARQYSRNEPMSFDWFCRQIGWPPYVPKNIQQLVHLEAVHDAMDLYLWLRLCENYLLKLPVQSERQICPNTLSEDRYIHETVVEKRFDLCTWNFLSINPTLSLYGMPNKESIGPWEGVCLLWATSSAGRTTYLSAVTLDVYTDRWMDVALSLVDQKGQPKSYRFMDMFPDAELVRDIQKQLDTTVIQEGVANITKLIQATQDVKALGAVTKATDETAQSAVKAKGRLNANEADPSTRIRASEKLIQMGVLTKEQLSELRSEFTNTSSHLGRSRKKRKK